MKKKLLFILMGSTIIFMFSLVSCEKCGPFADKFKVVGIDFSTISAVYDETAEWELERSEIKNDTVKHNFYSILIEPRIEAFFSLNKRTKTFNLINSAYACSPGYPETDEKIDDIIITAQLDFNEDYPAGDNLVDLFDVVVLDEANSIYYDKFTLSDYLSTKPSPPLNSMTLILNQTPDKSKRFAFKVEYFQDGIDVDFFEFETEPIFIKID